MDPHTSYHWDAFDQLQEAFGQTSNAHVNTGPQASLPPVQAPQGAHQYPTCHPVHQPLFCQRIVAEPQRSTAGLSLDRYLDLLQLLTGGPDVNGIYRVRELSNIERSAARVEDLKQVLTLHRLSAGQKNKNDLLERMKGMRLVPPIVNLEAVQSDYADGSINSSQELLHILNSTGIATHLDTLSATLSQQGFYSCCPLPHINLPSLEVQHQQTQTTQAEESITVVSQGARPGGRIIDTSQQADVDMEENEVSFKSVDHQPSEWLVNGIKKVKETCQACEDALYGAGLVGRKIAIILMDDFEQGDPQGVVDTVQRGVHIGQVVEWIGEVHNEENCPVDCSEQHCFCFVRVAPTTTTPEPVKKGRRRLDLAVDLQSRYRVDHLESLLSAGEERLDEAWVLLQPREDLLDF